jgi:hypothetical protein
MMGAADDRTSFTGGGEADFYDIIPVLAGDAPIQETDAFRAVTRGGKGRTGEPKKSDDGTGERRARRE